MEGTGRDTLVPELVLYVVEQLRGTHTHSFSTLQESMPYSGSSFNKQLIDNPFFFFTNPLRPPAVQIYAKQMRQRTNMSEAAINFWAGGLGANTFWVFAFPCGKSSILKYDHHIHHEISFFFSTREK